jgi:spore coat polysaccharide biosynthesis protein SpsF (cytidylyltransferase family)
VINVLIGVQARSTSTRLPKKSIALIDTQTVTDHVLSACLAAAEHINKSKAKPPVNVQVALLVPTGDQLKYLFMDKVDVLEGSEHNVLSRYMLAVDRFKPDYVVRISGDCPLITPPMISKNVLCSVFDKLDYCSNVPDSARTYLDGLDCEVISSQLMQWVNENATEASDREHVTTYIRSHTPEWARVGSIMAYIDLSEIKLSVDTIEDLEKIRANKKMINDKLNAVKRRGHHVYRF